MKRNDVIKRYVLLCALFFAALFHAVPLMSQVFDEFSSDDLAQKIESIEHDGFSTWITESKNAELFSNGPVYAPPIHTGDDDYDNPNLPVGDELGVMLVITMCWVIVKVRRRKL